VEHRQLGRKEQEPAAEQYGGNPSERRESPHRQRNYAPGRADGRSDVQKDKKRTRRARPLMVGTTKLYIRLPGMRIGIWPGTLGKPPPLPYGPCLPRPPSPRGSQWSPSTIPPRMITPKMVPRIEPPSPAPGLLPPPSRPLAPTPAFGSTGIGEGRGTAGAFGSGAGSAFGDGAWAIT
jgi:hypothetical protein